MTTGHKCPACGESLHAYYDGQWILWCANGKCPSAASNDGRIAETIKQAAKYLEEAIENE